MNSNFRNLAIWVVIGLLLMALFNLFQNPGQTRRGNEISYTDFLAGARYIAPLAENWRLTITTDLSGGDTEGTWSVGGYAGYRAGPHHFIAGYRHVDMELEASGGDKRVTQVFSGPLVAYGFSF